MADITVDPTLVLKGASSQLLQCVSGATITAGKPIYVSPTTNIAVLADSNGAPPINACSGMSLNAASTGQILDYVATDALLTLGAATLTAGSAVYLSDTPGGLTMDYTDIASGSTVIIVGVALSTSTMNLKPVVGGVK